MAPRLSQSDYRSLAEFRYQIRRFLGFSERAARDSGLEPRQHQLLLALKGLPEGREPTIGDLAERLSVEHHSAVEMIDRLERARLVLRVRDQQDRRRVLVQLTAKGEALLSALSLSHREELQAAAPALVHVLKSLVSNNRRAVAAERRRNGASSSRRPSARKP